MPPIALTTQSFIQSVQLFLSSGDIESLIELDVIGFEYGLCKSVDVTGGISEIGFDYLPSKGIHRLRITNNHPDGAVTHEFGGSGSTE